MESRPKSSHGQTSLFQVYLRLRPPTNSQHDPNSEDYLSVEPPISLGTRDDESSSDWPTQITVLPPNDSRKRAVEKFAFTKVFQKQDTQLDVFRESGVISLIKGVLQESRDGLVATLGVTGSGKSHTILGSKSQRGITQMSLDVIFRSLDTTLQCPDETTKGRTLESLLTSDSSEAQIYSARAFLEDIYGGLNGERGGISRAQTPMNFTKLDFDLKETSFVALNNPRRPHPPRPSALPQVPDTSDIVIPVSPVAESVVLISMYEVYNDRIFDLLSLSNTSRPVNKQRDRRRPLFFKSTEVSTDRKVVTGLRKIVCYTYEEALMVLQTGLIERRVAGTGSNTASSRSHGFFCIEVKTKATDEKRGSDFWVGNTLTIVDLAGSERARNAKTAGTTLAEAGKINESLMYLGQCLQMQSDFQDRNKAPVPFRQCKLTELLFSNLFPSSNHAPSNPHSKNTQKAVMLVTADPQGDFNATSQILRYSALAREVSVPRTPSVTSTMLSGFTNGSWHKNPANGKSSGHSAFEQQLEVAALEIAQISDEYEIMARKLAEEEIGRAEAEMKWKAAESKCLLVEQEVREECWMEMEQRMGEERSRWQQAWDEEATRHEDHLDKKLDIFFHGVKIHEDPEPDVAQRNRELELENDNLRRKIAQLEHEFLSGSPTKRMKSKKNTMPGRFDSTDFSFTTAGSGSDVENTIGDVRGFPLHNEESLFSNPLVSAMPIRKPKRLTARQWDLAPEIV